MTYRPIERWRITGGGKCPKCGLAARIRRAQTFRLASGGRARVTIWDHGEDVREIDGFLVVRTIECVQTEVDEGGES